MQVIDPAMRVGTCGTHATWLLEAIAEDHITREARGHAP